MAAQVRSGLIVAGSCTAAAVAGVVAQGPPILALVLFGLLALPLVGVLAVEYPEVVLVGGLVLLATVPFVGIPVYGILHPGLLALWCIALFSVVGLVWGRAWRPSPVDYCAGVVFLGMALSALTGHQSISNFLIFAGLWLGPYLAARTAVASGHLRVAIVAVAAAGIVAIPFGLIEFAGDNFVLAHLPSASAPGLGLNSASERLGAARLQGSFGQPIPFAMVMVMAAVCALALSFNDRRHRYAWLLLAAALVVLQATSLSRTGWLMLVVVAAFVTVLRPSLVFSRRNAALIVGGVVLVVAVLAIPTTRDLMLGTGATASQTNELERSARYRADLRAAALRPGYIDPLGTQETQVGPGGITSIDNAYIKFGWDWGYAFILGMFAMVPAMGWTAWRLRESTEAVLLCGLGIAILVAILSVSLLTQQQIFAWYIFGCVAGLLQGVPTSPRSEIRTGRQTLVPASR